MQLVTGKLGGNPLGLILSLVASISPDGLDQILILFVRVCSPTKFSFIFFGENAYFRAGFCLVKHAFSIAINDG